MLICDSCDAAAHAMCVGFELGLMPAGEWFCPTCSTLRSSILSPDSREEYLRRAESVDAKRGAGRFIDDDNHMKLWPGRIRFIGIHARPLAFELLYDDGVVVRASLADAERFRRLGLRRQRQQGEEAQAAELSATAFGHDRCRDSVPDIDSATEGYLAGETGKIMRSICAPESTG